MRDVFVARQPIFDANMEVVAYELLFRAGNHTTAQFSNGDHATSHLLVNALVDIGLEKLVGDQPAFINFTRPFLVGEQPLPLANDRLVLEVLEDIPVDDDLICGLKNLSQEGYKIALDDFAYRPELEPLLELANFVKIDLLALSPQELQEHFQLMRKLPVRLLAEKIETKSEFEMCKQMGFELFQGYFLCQPGIIQGKRCPQNKMLFLRLMSKLHDPNVSFKELETLIRQDVALSYKLLRFANSAFYGMSHKVESLQQGLVVLGLAAIRNVVSLLAMTAMEDTPKELIRTAVTRAKMCELLAKRLRFKEPPCSFTIGLFSVLDALLDQPMDQVLTTLPFSEVINNALLMHAGEMGEILRCVIAHERGAWELVEHPGLEPEDFSLAYMESLAWMNLAMGQLSAASSAPPPVRKTSQALARGR